MSQRRARRRWVVIGAAGQARETAALIADLDRAGEPGDVVGFVVSDTSKLGPRDSGERVLGDYGWLRAHRGEIDAFALGIGTPAARLKVGRELAAEFPEIAWPALVHPTVVVDRASLRLERGSMLAPGVVATVNIAVEEFAMVNFGATIGHETVVGPGSVINPGVNLSGGVVIAEGVLVGAGAVVLQYRSVGRGATVGAGAVVTRDVAEGVTVVGIPARPMLEA